MKKILIILLTFFYLQTNSQSAENTYLYGSGKYFSYGIEKSDLQVINKSLVSLGYSSSSSSTDNTGFGFDIGFGVEMSPNVFLEGGYVNYGTLTINTKTTGPAETLKLDINGNGVTGAVKMAFESMYVKAGMHSWDFSGKISGSLGTATEPLGSGTDPFFGFGFGADGFELGYEYYAIDDGDISSLTARISHKF